MWKLGATNAVNFKDVMGADLGRSTSLRSLEFLAISVPEQFFFKVVNCCDLPRWIGQIRSHEIKLDQWMSIAFYWGLLVVSCSQLGCGALELLFQAQAEG